MSLEKRTVSAFGWSGIEKVGQALSGLAVQLVLARLLAPEDFALIAMVAIFLELGRSFVDVGFSASLVQSPEVSQRDLTTVFYFNLAAAVILGGLLVLAAPAVAAFYGQPLLEAIVAVLSLRLLLDAAGSVHGSILTRRIDLKSHAKARLPATIVGGIVGVAMALSGFGAWSLVGQVLAQAGTRSLLFWFLSRWRPSGLPNPDSLRRLAPFGSKLFASALLDKGFRNVYLVVIGKLFPPAALGHYFLARKYQQLPSTPLVRVLNQTLLPVFSQAQADDDRLRPALAKGARLLSLAYFPAILGLAAVAEPLIEWLITDKWLPAVPYLQLLLIASLALPLQALNGNVIAAKGEAGRFLTLQLKARGIELAALLITFRFGIPWMIVGQILAATVAWFLHARVVGQLLDFGVGPQARAALPSLVSAGLMGALVLALGQFLQPLHPLALLATQVVTGIGLYVGLTALARPKAMREFSDVLRNRKSKTTG